jgi:hypothetical protein
MFSGPKKVWDRSPQNDAEFDYIRIISVEQIANLHDIAPILLPGSPPWFMIGFIIFYAPPVYYLPCQPIHNSKPCRFASSQDVGDFGPARWTTVEDAEPITAVGLAGRLPVKILRRRRLRGVLV